MDMMDDESASISLVGNLYVPLFVSIENGQMKYKGCSFILVICSITFPGL